ncbi:hypothetical protein NC652_035709 [Populus alba x Populus x berolinensis]|nr:hypothetical protein NC652_035709 [Populus alba x Populus x berolinensis]
MLHEWMIDVPDRLSERLVCVCKASRKTVFCGVNKRKRLSVGSEMDQYCIVFPSALPNGAKKRDGSGPNQSYCILDCIFHEACTLSDRKYTTSISLEGSEL